MSSNTYAINTVRGEEFKAEAALRDLGLHPWVPRLLVSKSVKEKIEPIWYDKPYVPKLIFCVFPAVYWNDVLAIKHIVTKPFPFTQRDIDGRKAGFLTHPKPNEHLPLLDAGGKKTLIAAKAGLVDFKHAVEAEYADVERLRANNEYQCQYVAGQALEMLDAAFKDLPAQFRDVVRRAHDEHPKLRVDVDMMGGKVVMEVSPDAVTPV